MKKLLALGVFALGLAMTGAARADVGQYDPYKSDSYKHYDSCKDWGKPVKWDDSCDKKEVCHKPFKDDHKDCDYDHQGDWGGKCFPAPKCGDPSAVPVPASAELAGAGVVGVIAFHAARRRKAMA